MKVIHIFTCAICKKTETSEFEMSMYQEPLKPYCPTDWTQLDAILVCPSHAIAIDDKPVSKFWGKVVGVLKAKKRMDSQEGRLRCGCFQTFRNLLVNPKCKKHMNS